jgi:hypothetical protein
MIPMNLEEIHINSREVKPMGATCLGVGPRFITQISVVTRSAVITSCPEQRLSSTDDWVRDKSRMFASTLAAFFIKTILLE